MREHLMPKYIEARIQKESNTGQETRSQIASMWHHAAIVWEYIDAIDHGDKEKHTDEIGKWKLTAEAMALVGRMPYTKAERAIDQYRLHNSQTYVIANDTLSLIASISSYIIVSTQDPYLENQMHNNFLQPATIRLLNKCMIAACNEVLYVYRASHNSSAILKTIEFLEHLVGFQEPQKNREESDFL